MSTEFTKLFEHVRKLQSRYLRTLAAYKIFDSFKTLTAINKVGKKGAKHNIKVFNDYKYFFLTTKEACRCYFFIEIVKFFDKSNIADPLSVYYVLDYAEDNLDKLKKSDFLAYHKNREILPELFQEYKEFTQGDINKLRRKIDNKETLILKSKDYRNQYLAHDDINKISVSISKSEVRQLLNLIKSIIRLFYLKLDFSTNSYKNFDEMPMKDIKGLLENLQKLEKNRIKKIVL